MEFSLLAKLVCWRAHEVEPRLLSNLWRRFFWQRQDASEPPGMLEHPPSNVRLVSQWTWHPPDKQAWVARHIAVEFPTKMQSVHHQAFVRDKKISFSNGGQNVPKNLGWTTKIIIRAKVESIQGKIPAQRGWNMVQELYRKNDLFWDVFSFFKL